MHPPFPTPRHLVEALHQSHAIAREHLWHWVHDPVERLTSQLVTRHGLDYQHERLTLYALHALATHLRARRPADFEGLSWQAFRAAVLLYVAKMAFHPWRGSAESVEGPEPLPECPAYGHQTFSRPCEQIGSCRTGGDWLVGTVDADGSLWVLVGDVTGHGYCAYLLASNLPRLWRLCWRELGPERATPFRLLEALHGRLAECLPEGVYVEGTLVRLRPDGEVQVAPAGGSRLLLRSGPRHEVTIHALRGSWLGLFPPDPDNLRTWRLEADDELVTGSDGLFEQLATPDAAGGPFATLLERSEECRPLFEALHDVLLERLRQFPQRDDITMVALRRCAEPVRKDSR